MKRKPKHYSGRLVAVDTNVLIWGIREVGPAEQCQRASWLFQQLEEEEAQVLVSAVVLSEYLVPVDPRCHMETITGLAARFLIMPFDMRASSLAAKLFRLGKEGLPKGVDGARRALKADSLIIATASTHGATDLFSGDPGLRSLAANVPTLRVSDLPKIPPDLFGYTEKKLRSRSGRARASNPAG